MQKLVFTKAKCPYDSKSVEIVCDAESNTNTTMSVALQSLTKQKLLCKTIPFICIPGKNTKIM